LHQQVVAHLPSWRLGAGHEPHLQLLAGKGPFVIEIADDLFQVLRFHGGALSRHRDRWGGGRLVSAQYSGVQKFDFSAKVELL
jgi:hypothetical protein